MVATTRNGKETIFGQHGVLSVKGNKIVDKNGKPVQLKGVSTHNMNSFPEFVNNDAIEYMADNWGMELYRLAMYSAWADGDKGYSDGTDEHRAFLEEIICRSARKCAELGIYCLVDWHILFDYNPNMNKDMALKFFDKISAALKDLDNVIYEICNEPSQYCEWNQLIELATLPDGADRGSDVCTWDDIKAYANEVIPVIRANAPKSIIVCGTPIWSQRVDEAAKSPLEFENIAYALHFYASTHKQNLRDIAKEALDAGIAIYVTEYGITDASGDGAIDYEETDRWLAFLKENDISYTLWNLSNKAENSAMIKPDCNKITAWDYDELTECGQWFVNLNK